MSGIAGIVNLDGAPVDRRLLRRMTAYLARRGPDALATWSDGHVGLGHTLLRTTDTSASERQPCTLDGRVWIASDARVDGRSDLTRRLESLGCGDLAAATDVDLILHAYGVWGEGCVEHLIGDFAFAIWDQRRGRLFCARDHFGVKPFYYAQVRDCFVFSNTLAAVRLHPSIPDELNELAIGDFLLFGFNQEPTTTSFADVHRLAPAHCLSVSPQGTRARRYWTLPTDGQIRYRRSRDYVEQFDELLRAAVGDRLRTERAGVWMSGGLDSTAITATAQTLLTAQSASPDLRAYTVVFDHLFPDDERRYTRVAADALEIPVQYLLADEYGPFDGWDQPELLTPEPIDDPFLLLRRNQLRQAAAHAPLLLSGDGGDEVLWRSDLLDLVGRMRPWLLCADVACAVFRHRRRPSLGLRAKLESRRHDGRAVAGYPRWLDAAFARRLRLPARWEALSGRRTTPSPHPRRPEAYRRLTSVLWSSCFEWSDPGVTGVAVEVRYPFLDVRLVGYLLAIPPIPWCHDKTLLRVTMRGMLPEPVRLRPKTPLAGDPLQAHLRRPRGEWVDRFAPTPELSRYVDRKAVPPVTGSVCERDDSWANLRPLCLSHWLTHGRHVQHPPEDATNDHDQVECREAG